MNSKPSKQRLDWLDRLKGLAILSVVGFHFFQNYYDDLSLVKILASIGAKLGYAVVDIFFTIAGFNIGYGLASSLQKRAKEEINWVDWLRRRLFRLYPTYWLIFGFTLLIYYVFNNQVKLDAIGYFRVFTGLTSFQEFKQVNPGFWFFCVILQAYLITPLLLLACNYRPRNILCLGIAIGLVTKALCWLAQPGSELYWLLVDKNLIFSYITQFCLGIYWGFIYFKEQNFRKIDIYGSAIAFSLGLSIYLGSIFSHQDIVYKLGLDLLFNPLSFLLLYYLLKAKITWSSTFLLNILSRLGIYSYQIYLTHQPVFFVLFPLWIKYIHIHSYLKLLLAAIVMPIILFVYIYSANKLDLWIGRSLSRWMKLS
jgi:peptidoglycan/LPS O-acetylase OafA/YrhL